jgi:hypothetical protein
MTAIEYAYIAENIDQVRYQATMSTLMDKVGMGNLQWGHLVWSYQQVIGKTPFLPKTLPSIDPK